MSRRVKKEIIRPTLETEFHKFEYSCPTCEKKVWQNFSLIKPIRADTKVTNSYWCKKCGVTHCVTYRLFKKRNGKPKIKIFAFTSDGKASTKRFKLLEPATKGERKYE